MILEVPTRLTPGSGWFNEGSNQTQLRLFLAAYGVAMDDCYEIRFSKRSMEVRRYALTKYGHKFMGEDGEVARREAATYKYRSGLTPKVH